VAHFYGTLQGCRGEASRCGNKDSGMQTYCASWGGAVRSQAYINPENGEDWVRVTLQPWHGSGRYHLLYNGPISGAGLPEPVYAPEPEPDAMAITPQRAVHLTT
jgi:hypothetical protein